MKYIVTSKDPISIHFPPDFDSGYPNNQKDFCYGEIFEYPGKLTTWIESGTVKLYTDKDKGYKKKKIHRSIDDNSPMEIQSVWKRPRYIVTEKAGKHGVIIPVFDYKAISIYPNYKSISVGTIFESEDDLSRYLEGGDIERI